MLQLANGRLRAVIDPTSGGRLISFAVAGVELIPDHPHRHPDFLRGCFPLAPWCGMLPGGPDGSSDDHPKHGLVHSASWKVLHADPTRVDLEIHVGPGTPRPWLGSGRLVLGYRLAEDALELRLSITAVKGTWPASLGFHPWFRRRLAGDTEDVCYVYRPTARLVRDDDRWPRISTAHLGPYPHDDVFVGMVDPPEVRWPGGPGLRLDSDADVWVVYERDSHGFCIEPWTDTDGPLSNLRTPPLPEGATRELVLRLSLLSP